jgi:uncharacterized protein involved in exopolysaccharide biosynthesis
MKINNSSQEKISAIDLLIIIYKRKRIILGLPAFFAIVSVLVCLALPNIYRANAKILPPQQAQSGAAAILAQLGGVAGAAAGAAGIKNPNDLYIGMLKSRSIADRLIDRFSLKSIYGESYLENARKTLADNTTISTSKDGLISIDVEDVSSKRSAEIANAYVEELLLLTKRIAVTEASQRRLFFEKQLLLSKNNLAETESKLSGGMDSHGVASVDAKSRAVVETAARLHAQVAAKEIQLSSMRAIFTAENSEYKRAAQELASMRLELSRQENGRDVVDAPKDLSHSGLDSIKLLRDVKYYQMLYELLSKQYEVARLDESKDTSIIQVLDKAFEPERKYKPMRAVIVFISTFFGLLLALGLAYFLERMEIASRNPDVVAKLAELKSELSFRRSSRS